jgi:hypothetical protein
MEVKTLLCFRVHSQIINPLMDSEIRIEFCVQLFQFSALVSYHLFRVINNWSRNYPSPELNHKRIAKQSKLWRNTSNQRREERKGGRRHVPRLNSRKRKRPRRRPRAPWRRRGPWSAPTSPPSDLCRSLRPTLQLRLRLRSPAPSPRWGVGRPYQALHDVPHSLTHRRTRPVARSNGSSLLHHQPRHSSERRRRRRRPTRPFPTTIRDNPRAYSKMILQCSGALRYPGPLIRAHTSSANPLMAHKIWAPRCIPPMFTCSTLGCERVQSPSIAPETARTLWASHCSCPVLTGRMSP